MLANFVSTVVLATALTVRLIGPQSVVEITEETAKSFVRTLKVLPHFHRSQVIKTSNSCIESC